ncbi:MAG: metallopeptidase family protein [Pseudomonadota bacterium]
MDSRQIIMNYTVPPSLDDMEVISSNIVEGLPEELLDFCEGVALSVEDMPDDLTEQDLDLEDPFDLLALYKSGKEIAPGIEKKTANDDDLLILYRRAILDLWCETQEDLNGLIRQVVIEELGRHFDFSDDEIDDMVKRHHQGML